MHSFVEEFFPLGTMYLRFIFVLHVSVCSFLILSIPEQECASLFIHSATGGHMDCFSFRLLQMKVLWTFYTNFFVYMFLFLFGKYLGVKSLGRRIDVYLFL